ncbi:MAG: hypothetical protein AABZ45_11850 [Pseudomonadota bacterium]
MLAIRAGLPVGKGNTRAGLPVGKGNKDIPPFGVDWQASLWLTALGSGPSNSAN